MMERNPLKEKCREILNTKDEIIRSRKKIELKSWIKQQTETGLIQMIAELDKNELGMSMNCGLFRNAYNYAQSRYMELKDREDETGEEQLTDETLASNDKPVLDEEQGIDQFPKEAMKKILHNTDYATLCIFSRMIYAEAETRPEHSDPATG